MSKPRMLITLGAMLFCGFLLTSTISYLVSRNSIRQSILQNELPLSSNNIYSEIEHDLFEPILISSLMANDTFVKDWILHGETDEPAISQYLQHIQEKYGTITSFLVSERTRKYYHSGYVLKVVREDNPLDAWFFRVRKMKSDYEINVDPDLADKNAMTIFINYRVLDKDGNFLAATGVGLSVSSVKALMEEYRTRYHRDVYFYDRSGKLVLASVGNKASAGVSDRSSEAAMRAVLDQIKAGQTNIMTSVVGSNGAMANYRYIPELNWILVVEQASDGTRPILLQSFGLNFVICLITAIVLLSIIRQTILRYQQRLESSNRQLIERKQQLLSANAAREKLFSVIGHDLRAPIANVKSSLDLLSEGTLSVEEFRRFQNDLRIGVDHVHLALENLMGWGTLQANTLQPRLENLDLRAAVQEGIDFLSLVAKEKNIRVENSVSAAACVLADSHQIQSVIRNLLSNALKFTLADGSVLFSAAETGGFWRVNVQDSGVGIDAHRIGRLLDADNDLTSTVGTANERGLGLGLQLCIDFIRLNHGTLSVQSSPGQGATFSFVLPSAPSV